MKRRRRVWSFVVLVAGLLAASLTVASSASAQPATDAYTCRIGKPSYCHKYGVGRCPLLNNRADGTAACERWTVACFDCHDRGMACRNDRKLTTADLACASCQAVVTQCLHAIDARLWPNRMNPTEK